MKRWIVAALFALLPLVGVSAWLMQPQLTTVTVPYGKAKTLEPPPSFMAGAATVDITPPPGYLPRAGYAMWSTVGQGFRTRLYARAYYLRDVTGRSHLFVQTDLTSGSRILHTKLGEVLSKETDIDASNLTITATHTHSSPGQFLGSQFYNKHISNQPGFAEDYFEFLLTRIHEAALTAFQSQRPAKLAVGKTNVWGLTRNRSIQAYVQNENVEDKSEQDHRTFHSVDPALYMVRIDTETEPGTYEPLGAFASFSIHGTALPRDETLFNADVWAYIHKDWERGIEELYRPQQKVHMSAFEGTHGDVAPAARFGMLGYIEARRLGQSIAQRALALYRSLDGQLTDQVTIRSAARHIDIRENTRAGDAEICRNAALGNTLAAAPLEHTSPLIGELPFIKQGSRQWWDDNDCQGRKRILGFPWLQSLLEPKDSFPDYVLFQVVQINDLTIVPLPFELTTEAGRRVGTAVAEAYGEAGQPHPQVMVASLAGGYTGYVTTPEEYGRQYYEGGHTLYGKDTQPYLAAQVKRLTADMLQSSSAVVELPEQWAYRFESRRFMPTATLATGRREIVEVPVFRHAKANEEGHWRFSWRDVNPTRINLHHPLLSIETRLNGGPWEPLLMEGWPVDDQGYDMAVRLIESSDETGMAVYSGYWFNPLFDGEQREYRFVVQARDEQEILRSPAFH